MSLLYNVKVKNCKHFLSMTVSFRGSENFEFLLLRPSLPLILKAIHLVK